MADLVALTMVQNNDETVLMNITRVNASDDLTLVTSLEFYLKPDSCTADTDPTVLKLTTANPTQMIISSQTAALIVARAFVPASALALPYDRFWHIDGLVATSRRTAMYGPVALVDL